MKKASVIVVVCALALFAGASSWAQVIAFPVKVRGAISFPVSESAATKVGVTEASLVAIGDHLLLLVDQSNHVMQLVETDAQGGIVSTLMTSDRLSVLPDGNFSAAMRFSFTLPPQANSLSVNGDINLTGKITPKGGFPKSIKGTIAGVLNDSVSGDESTIDIIIKGKLSKSGTPFLLPAAR